MLKGLFVALLSVMLTSCATHSDDTAEKTTLAFYQQYLQAFADFDPANAEQSPLANNSPLIKRYVASDTASRLAEIGGIYEQEIVGADYFTYCQDYAPEWVKALLVGKASMQFGGAKVPVSIGIGGDKYLQLMVYLKREDNKWKIYRVRNVTDNVEQYIFDDIAIKNAKAYAKDNPEPQ